MHNFTFNARSTSISVPSITQELDDLVEGINNLGNRFQYSFFRSISYPCMATIAAWLGF